MSCHMTLSRDIPRRHPTCVGGETLANAVLIGTDDAGEELRGAIPDTLAQSSPCSTLLALS